MKDALSEMSESSEICYYTNNRLGSIAGGHDPPALDFVLAREVLGSVATAISLTVTHPSFPRGRV
jgi:hypothetical protein